MKSKKSQLPVSREGLQRLRQGHPWIFRSQLEPALAKRREAAVIHVGEHWFFYSPQSEIALRRLGPSTRLWAFDSAAPVEGILTADHFDQHFGAWLEAHAAETLRRKQALVEGERCLRWIFSESDLIPGLVVDIFDNVLVAQLQTAPMETFWPAIAARLERAFAMVRGQPASLLRVLRQSPSRRKEGLEVEKAHEATANDARWIQWNGLEWKMAPGTGQKTGAYFDQRDNHRAAVAWAKRLGCREAWDLCCFEGGFGLHLAKAGLGVLAVDESKGALATAAENARHNGVDETLYRTQQGDVFEFLRERFDRRATDSPVDMIVLDPPGFVKDRAQRESALRGFKELNLRALHCLRPGGLLVTCGCSHHVSRQDFGRMLAEAAHDARRTVKVLEIRGPSPDHAPVTGLPEAEYLQAWFVEVE